MIMKILFYIIPIWRKLSKMKKYNVHSSYLYEMVGEFNNERMVTLIDENMQFENLKEAKKWGINHIRDNTTKAFDRDSKEWYKQTCSKMDEIERSLNWYKNDCNKYHFYTLEKCGYIEKSGTVTIMRVDIMPITKKNALSFINTSDRNE